MKKYVCNVCGYIYDFEEGDLDSDIVKNIFFEDFFNDWVCLVCGVDKEYFELVE